LNAHAPVPLERALILAPWGRDSAVAADILREAGIHSDICFELDTLLHELMRGADVSIVTEEALRGLDYRALAEWVARQPPWSDFPFIVLTQHGGGIERNPTAAQLTATLGNVSFLERPFHPTTLVSLVLTNLRGRRRQYECRRLNEELELRVQDRTAELASTNRELVAQIEERERVEHTLRQMQRLEAVGQLTSGVAHDFNNLLTVVLGNINFLERSFAADGVGGKAMQRLGYMRAAAERGAKLTDQLLSFSRRQRLEPKVLDLNESVAGMHDLLQSTIGGSIGIETRLAQDLWPALVDPTQLELAVLNLAINARDAMQIGGTLSVSTRNVRLGSSESPEEPLAGDYVEVRVADSGAGMSAAVRARVFEPFFTTKEVGKGSGLGLSQVLGFAKQSGGGVRIQSRPSEGTAVHIYLPRAHTKATAAAVATPTVSRSDHPGARLLVVDDDAAVREVTGATLRDVGYRVEEAGSGRAALATIDGRAAFDLAIIDFAMPGMSGAELARQINKRRPDLPVLFVTGFAERGKLAGVGDDRIVSQPFLDSELTEQVRRALAEARSEVPR
jgi:signal transduction histidine kinase